MNFEFLKNLNGLSGIYENCSNAEKLSTTMPVQSIFTSRKSAELLAKFIYMTAHNQAMENLTFADILSDKTFQKFINNRNMLDAFHYIRKMGNAAVHGDNNSQTSDAISVLQDLHFVTGETACKLNLIDQYPLFDENIKEDLNAKYVEISDVDRRAQDMFVSYIQAYNSKQLDEDYICENDYDQLQYHIEGNIEMHEYLEFKHAPKQVDLIEYIQKYLVTLIRFSIEQSPEHYEELGLENPAYLKTVITVGDSTYSSDNIESFLKFIIEVLPHAENFTIDNTFYGITREYYREESNDIEAQINMICKDAVWTGAGMLDTLQQYMRRQSFTYKLSAFYPDSGEFKYEKIDNGRLVDVLHTGTEDIINMTFDEKWYSYMNDLWVEFDEEKHPHLLDKLHDIVRTSLPESEIPYCEDEWESDPFHLCIGIQWNCQCLREVQNFLDRINKVLLPIKSDIYASTRGTWEISDLFAVASWRWSDHGFVISGLCY